MPTRLPFSVIREGAEYVHAEECSPLHVLQLKSGAGPKPGTGLGTADSYHEDDAELENGPTTCAANAFLRRANKALSAAGQHATHLHHAFCAKYKDKNVEDRPVRVS